MGMYYIVLLEVYADQYAVNMNLNADYYVLDMPLNIHNDISPMCIQHTDMQIHRFS